MRLALTALLALAACGGDPSASDDGSAAVRAEAARVEAERVEAADETCDVFTDAIKYINLKSNFTRYSPKSFVGWTSVATRTYKRDWCELRESTCSADNSVIIAAAAECVLNVTPWPVSNGPEQYRAIDDCFLPINDLPECCQRAVNIEYKMPDTCRSPDLGTDGQ